MADYPIRVGGFLMLDAKHFVCIDKICVIDTYQNTTAVYTVDGAAAQTQFTAQAIVDAIQRPEPPAHIKETIHIAAKDIYECYGRLNAIRFIYRETTLNANDAERYVEHYFEGL